MFSRQPWTHQLILAILLAVLPGRLPAQETATDARFAKLVAEVLKADERLYSSSSNDLNIATHRFAVWQLGLWGASATLRR